MTDMRTLPNPFIRGFQPPAPADDADPLPMFLRSDFPEPDFMERLEADIRETVDTLRNRKVLVRARSFRACRG
jgi:hypothetical protein